MATAKVKVNEVSHTTITSAKGVDLNYCVLKGYDDTNSKGFSKRFFATKKDGDPTRNAEIADTLQPNDWVEVTMDDTTYKNVQTIKKISEPAGGSAPDQSNFNSAPAETKSSSSPKGGARSGDQLNRATALELAIEAIRLGESFPSTKTVLDVAEKFEHYIVNGFGNPTMTYDQSGPAGQDIPVNEPNPDLEDAVGDDDIPF